MTNDYRSWGNYPKVLQSALPFPWRCDTLPINNPAIHWVLPYGNGRSYGDSALNNNYHIIPTRSLDHFIQFDETSGVFRCEAGVLLSEILEFIVPKKWFLPVMPGTKYVTVGGAIANDIHGKNHHLEGTFGQHLRCFELLRSDNSRSICSAETNSELFKATVGGLGLTGLITWAEIQLNRVKGTNIQFENIKFSHLAEFFDLAKESDQDYEYTVAWIDCVATGPQLGRGLFSRGNHTASDGASSKVDKKKVTFPFSPPVSLVNKLSLTAFNHLYYAKQKEKYFRGIIHYDPFFFPLDNILEWNRMYGSPGFLQYQCVVPMNVAYDAIADMLKLIAKSNLGSFLTVLKVFGNIKSSGYLSFPREGATLALDFPFKGEKTLHLLHQLDEITAASNGAVYPAKDARMSAQHFQQFFPNWKKLSELKDPHFSSSFWRRVTETDYG